MDAEVADVAVAVFHEGPPAARVLHAVIGEHRGRAGPHFPIQVIGRIAVFRVRPGAHAVITVNLHQADLTQLACLNNVVAGLNEVRRAAALGAHLHDSVVLPRRGKHSLPLNHVHANRLLHIDVRSGFDGGNHWQRMPMVRCADKDDVQVFLLEHLAVVMVGARRLLRRLARGNNLGCPGKHLFIHVAQ